MKVFIARISYVEEYTDNMKEKPITYILCVGEVIPSFPEGIPTLEKKDHKKLANKLKSMYKKYRDDIIKTTLTDIRARSVEWKDSSGADKKVLDKIRAMKFAIAKETTEYSENKVMLEIFLTFKPSVKPVFKDGYSQNAILYNFTNA